MLPNDTNVSSKPLFDWFDQNKLNRAALRAAGYSDGRITNWKRRGIPMGQVGRVAAFMGISYEQYIRLAEEAALRGKGWRQVAVVAFIFGLLPTPDANAGLHNQFSSDQVLAKALTEIHKLGLWARSLFRYLTGEVFSFKHLAFTLMAARGNVNAA